MQSQPNRGTDAINLERPRAGTLKRLLGSHRAFERWSDRQFADLEGHCQLLQAQPGTLLLEPGSVDPRIHFLLQGSLVRTDGNNAETIIESGSDDACYPIARLRPAMFRVHCHQASTVLLVEQSVLKRLSARPPNQQNSARFDLFGPAVSGSWQQQPLVTDLYHAIKTQSLQLPAIPGIALKVRRALASDNYQLSDITKIIAADPVISARLLHLANSPLFKGVAACDSLQNAVLRLGVGRVQNLVLALSTAGLFRTDNRLIKAHLRQTWHHLLDIGALTSALARLNGQLDPDIALLAGLLHEIGRIPILQWSAQHPELLQNPALLEDVLTGVAATVSIATLKQWALPGGVIAAAERQHQWSYDHEGATDYADLLLVAHVHGRTQGTRRYPLPKLDETPAFSRITGKRFSAEDSLRIIKEAASQTQALKQLLSGGPS